MKQAFDPRLWLARLGLPGLLGLALLGFAAWGEWVDAPKRQAAIAALQSETARLRTIKPGELPREERPQAMLSALYGRLQTPGQRSAALSGLLKRAQELGLSVESVQFRAQADRNAGLVRHEVQLPLKGTYPALREWIAKALQDQPALSLDAVQIRREQAQADPIEARVKATLWVRDEPRAVVARAKPLENRLLAQDAAPAALAEPNAKPREDYVVREAKRAQGVQAKAAPRAPKMAQTSAPTGTKVPGPAQPPRIATGNAAMSVKQPAATGPLSRVARIAQPSPAQAQQPTAQPPGMPAQVAPAATDAAVPAAPPVVASASAPAWPPSNLPPGMVLRAPPYTPAYASMPTQGRSTLPR